MTPKVSSWNLIQRDSTPVSGELKMVFESRLNSCRKAVLIERLDNELARLRAADVELVMNKRRCIIQIPMGSFKAERISIYFISQKLVIQAEDEVLLDEETSVMIKLCRRVLVPFHKLRTDIMTSYFSPLGILTLTFLKK